MLQGLLTVAQWDLKQRVRSRRLLIIWIVWAVILTAIAGGIVRIAYQSSLYSDLPNHWRASSGPTIFGFTVLLMLGFALVVVPIFSASAIVAERESATLATLQATTLTAVQIVGGKLASAAVVAAGFLAGGLPAVGLAVGVGQIGVGRALICLLVMYIEMVVLCAIALGWSAIAARSLASTVLTYLTAFTLSVVTLIAFALIGVLPTTYSQDRTWSLTDQQKADYAAQLSAYYATHPMSDNTQPPAPPLGQCTWQTSTYSMSHSHTERSWWLLLGNPFVIVSDAAPLPPDARGDIQAYLRDVNGDPLAMIAAAVRDFRLGDQSTYYDCFVGDTWVYFGDASYRITSNKDGTFTIQQRWYSTPDTRTTAVTPRPPAPIAPQTLTMNTPLWPIGLGVHIVIAVLFLWLAVRRVSVPYGVLPKGQRVA